jgi:ectoine hydroxylase-related dioxygenase (phytanoyl-CoA dioxygenase family)
MGRLSDDDLRRFGRDGYLLLRGVVSEELLAAANEEVDEYLPSEDGFPSAARLPRCHDLLRRSPAFDIARELVAPHALELAFDHLQVATTVPPWSHIPGGPHIDGHPGHPHPDSFTMLAGVMLTDQHEPQSGNLWVWPGSHLDHQRLFAERGVHALDATMGHATLLDPPLDLGPRIEILAARGDLLLAHYLVGHNKGGNTSPVVRRTIYARLAVPGHADRWEQTFVDPWTEYAPVRAALDRVSSS